LGLAPPPRGQSVSAFWFWFWFWLRIGKASAVAPPNIPKIFLAKSSFCPEKASDARLQNRPPAPTTTTIANGALHTTTAATSVTSAAAAAGYYDIDVASLTSW